MIPTYEDILREVQKAFHQDPSQKLMMMTGQGGCKDYVRVWCEQLGLEYNWRNFRRQYTFLRKTGTIKRWVCGKRCRGYEITS